LKSCVDGLTFGFLLLVFFFDARHFNTHKHKKRAFYNGAERKKERNNDHHASMKMAYSN